MPNSTSATPRRKIDAPIVMMIKVTTDASRTGSTRDPLEHQADPDRERDGDGDAERQRQSGAGREHRRHAADHDELALGEIDDLAGVVDDRKAERDQRVDRADREPGKHELQKLRHYVVRPAWRFLSTSLPGLTRQSMAPRVKPGGDGKGVIRRHRKARYIIPRSLNFWIFPMALRGS